jgi:hypothetical protein
MIEEESEPDWAARDSVKLSNLSYEIAGGPGKVAACAAKFGTKKPVAVIRLSVQPPPAEAA